MPSSSEGRKKEENVNPETRPANLSSKQGRKRSGPASTKKKSGSTFRRVRGKRQAALTHFDFTL